jgi:hypothetical protein
MWGIASISLPLPVASTALLQHLPVLGFADVQLHICVCMPVEVLARWQPSNLRQQSTVARFDMQSMAIAWMLISFRPPSTSCVTIVSHTHLLAYGHALCCARMQALFPSPFYFFDEVDCALDSLAAGRVAAFVRAQCNGSSSSSSFDGGSGGAEAASKPDVGVAAGAADQDMQNLNGDVAAAAKAETLQAGSSSAGLGHAAVDSIKSRQERAVRRVGAQYLLVSHRPVVFESAGCLLGVYSNGRGSSAAVVAHF